MFILMFLLYSVFANAANYDFNSILNYFSAADSGLDLTSTVPIKRKDIPRLNNFITKQISSCPDVGYFFQRELTKSSYPGSCYLCFCQENNTAVCWPRDNKRCDAESYNHGVGKRDTRKRRSPAGLSDIFFRDAARDLFNKQIPQVCKPFEDSYSQGCPPADWCIGCTVCDCDANGRWDCHTLSFCPEKEVKKKKKNSHRGPYKKKIYRRKARPPTNAITDSSAKSKTTQIGKGPVKNTKVARTNAGKVTKPSPVKKQTKKMQVSPVKRSPVNKKQLAKRSPQINKLNKRSPQLIKKPAAKRSQEIKKNAPIKRSQQVKRSVQKNSLVKKKPRPTRLPPGKKVTKKNKLVKKRAVKKMPLTKRSSVLAKKQQLVKRSPPKTVNSAPHTKKPIPRKVKATSRPVTVNKRVATVTTNKTPTTKRAVTPIEIQALKGHPDINAALGQEMVKTFMQTFQKIINKNLDKRLRKRSIAEEVMPLDMINNVGGQDNITASVGSSNELNVSEKYTKDIVTEVTLVTTAYSTNYTSNVTFESSQYLNEVTTNYPTTLNVVSDKYYKYEYSVDETVRTTTNNEELNNQEASTTKNATDETFVENNVTKTDNEIALQLIDNKNISSNTTVPDNKVAQNKTLTTQPNATVDNSYDANDLKFNQWYHVKALKDKEQSLRISLGANTTTVTANTLPKLNSTAELKKLRSSSIVKKVGCAVGKPKIRKILFAPRNKASKINANFSPKMDRIHLNGTKNDSKENVFKIFVHNVLKGFGKRNATKKSKANRFKVIKYLQKIFKKMFYRGDKQNKRNRSKLGLNKDSIMESLCESFGPCTMNCKKDIKLQRKIEDLSAETNTIVKSIKTIKGLLKLVDIANCDRDMSKHKKSFRDDIQKLNVILRETYSDGENYDKLTQTQLTQIDYIKKNTQTFIESTSRFANVLNEIIDMINKDKSEWKRISKYIKNEKETGPERLKDTSFEKMKDLLLKFNLIQNKFVKQMYEVLSKFQTPSTQSTINTKTIRSAIDFYDNSYVNQYKRSSDNYGNEFKRTTNNSAAIQAYTNNIIKNLRKLKALAQTLNSGRRKRDLRDNDSIEYLLVLMEYLLRQNYPLHIAPVNDEIDLLIEAIKLAPNIKTIKKNILPNTPIDVINIKSNYNASSEGQEYNIPNEDTASDLTKINKEDNLTAGQNYTKFNLIEQSFDNDSEDYMFMTNRKSNVKLTTETNDYNRTESVITEAIVEETTKTFVPIDTPSGVHKFEYVKDDTNKLIKLDNAESSEETNGANVIDVFHAEIDDDISTPEPSSTTELESKAEVATSTKAPVTNAGIVFDDAKLKHYDKEDISASYSADKKYLDCLDESFEEEEKIEANVTEALNKKYSEKGKMALDTVSSLTKERYNDRNNRLDSDDKIYKKEMHLLNSLDYGPDKSESDGSDSKELLEDKYGNEHYYGYKA